MCDVTNSCCQNGEENVDQEETTSFNTLVDTFNAVDKDGNAEWGYPEYVEAWKFLWQAGDDKAIK